MKIITDDSEIEIKENTLFFFYARWMPFYKKILISMEAVSKSFANIDVYGIDVDMIKSSKQRFSLDVVPTFLFYKTTLKPSRLEGVIKLTAIKSWLNKLLKAKEKKNDKKS